MAYIRTAGLGVAPVLIDTAVEWAGGLLTSNPRAGGADPCAPPGFNPTGTWPRNSNVGGAPPDYRSRGTPMEDPSPSGTGRIKDDAVDCIPIPYGGKWWQIGALDNGAVTLGPGENLDAAVWVQINPTTGAPVSVPGYGAVRDPSVSDAGRSPGAAVAGASIGPIVGAGLALAALLRLRR